jgi:hypothetical protein
MVVSTWIDPGCVQFLREEKRFHTAWVRSGHRSVALWRPLCAN